MSSDDSGLRKLHQSGRSLVSAVPSWLVGNRLDRSMVTVLLAAVLGLAVAVGAGTTIGSDRVADLVVETWTGAEFHVEVAVAACLLVGIGALSAAITSGFLPTFALVASVPFGIGLGRYGTVYAVEQFTMVVSLPEAIADGTGAAIVVGLPLAVLGYLVGASLRRIAGSNGGRFGPRFRPG
ncbi:hypothetical protein [Natrinema longum]|uniref:DUF8071 domain-containing protein n=1 Tax=Natrinema longum TaxID=370324 RepID=A0A8A2U9R9_9EURY|nr:hypothetical protein [Natrinema longum]MBZ6496730.1 hypothetical protein [Natrinema longum]QSW85377.1 hypothetical protein J0X27_00560 [Natrinema longum]